ncbi:MAG: F0F1 ATP synthase subunit epsilon [Aquiluna sp.]|nr:F0F1 ATP synthase subunit epsilon [Aquiluna sp.]MCF8546058.1 F0F1 ATP synthase subunit epsilon [Aquiluna sp.]
MSKELTVNLVSADKPIWSGNASMVVAKTAEGEIGLLAGHEPMLAILAPGMIKITPTEGPAVVAESLDGGFLSIERDVVMVVVRNASLVS